MQESNTPIFFLPLVILKDKARIVTKPSNVNTNNGNAESVGLSVGSYFMSKISSCCNPIALNLKDSPFGVLKVLVSKLSFEGGFNVPNEVILDALIELLGTLPCIIAKSRSHILLDLGREQKHRFCLIAIN